VAEGKRVLLCNVRFLRDSAIRFTFKPKETEIKEILEGNELKSNK
jgi:hypothetical protein